MMVQEYRKYWNPKMETIHRKELEELQMRKLRKQLAYVYEHSPFYGPKLREAKVNPAKIKTIEDFERYVPITSKPELRAAMDRTGNALPHLCTSIDNTRVIMGSVGTTGESTYFPMTRKDFELYSEACCRGLWLGGFRPGMVCHYICPALVAPLHAFAFMHMLQVSLIVNGVEPQYIGRVIAMSKLVKPEAFMLPVPFYMAIENELAKEGLIPKDIFNYKYFINYGDIFDKKLRERIEKVWGGVHTSSGGSAADIGAHCWGNEVEHNGLHFLDEDTIMIEVVNLKTGKAVNSGERGELVFTTLTREAAPHIRWRTEDLVKANYEPCSCGRTSLRVNYVGRVTFKVVVKGKDIFPSDIESVIRAMPETATYEFTSVKYAEDMDRLKLRLGCPPEKQSPEMKGKVEDKVSSTLNIPVEVEFRQPEEIPRVPHKFMRVIDETKK